MERIIEDLGRVQSMIEETLAEEGYTIINRLQTDEKGEGIVLIVEKDSREFSVFVNSIFIMFQSVIDTYPMTKEVIQINLATANRINRSYPYLKVVLDPVDDDILDCVARIDFMNLGSKEEVRKALYLSLDCFNTAAYKMDLETIKKDYQQHISDKCMNPIS